MTTILCKKLNMQLAALPKAPWPGELGQRIVSEISAQAWGDWKEHAKMLINENRVNLGSDEGRAFITAQMKAYLFGEGQMLGAEGYVPPAEHKHDH